MVYRRSRKAEIFTIVPRILDLEVSRVGSACRHRRRYQWTTYVFTEELTELFEQLIVQLQDFPAPPALYRPQNEEPSLTSGERIRILCGLSGAGKTAWAAQAALHSTALCAYYDTGDLPGPALASTLVREMAARFTARDQDGLRRILLPEPVVLRLLGVLIPT